MVCVKVFDVTDTCLKLIMMVIVSWQENTFTHSQSIGA